MASNLVAQEGRDNVLLDGRIPAPHFAPVNTTAQRLRGLLSCVDVIRPYNERTEDRRLSVEVKSVLGRHPIDIVTEHDLVHIVAPLLRIGTAEN